MMWKNSVIEFDSFSDFYIIDILERLYRNKSFYMTPFFHTKINEKGKERLICSLTIRDRIIQKAINQNFLLPAFIPSLIYDNMASIKNRGIDRAVNRLICHLQKAYRNYGNNFYILKCDIKSYYDSISHERCLNLASKYKKDERIIQIFNILFRLYKYDSFIHNGEFVDFGIGLGGEVPQSFGIIYLNEFDHICKEKLFIPYYIRYADDIILIHNDKEYLKYCLFYLSDYLNSISLQFNRNKTMILNCTQGVKFLKFHFNISNSGKVFIIPDKKGIKREKKKLYKFYNLLEDERITFSDILQNYSSWKGYINKSNSYELINYMDQLFNELFINEWY